MNSRKTIFNLRRNNKGISTVIATLLMIAIAVVASLVAYAWVMGYMNFTTTKTGNSIQIQSVAVTGPVYIQNVGTGTVKFSSANTILYVNGAAVPGKIDISKLDAGLTATFTPTANPFAAGNTYTVKVVADDGSFAQMTQTFP